MNSVDIVNEIILQAGTCYFENVLDACCGKGGFSKMIVKNGVSCKNIFLADKALDYLQLTEDFSAFSNVKYIPGDISHLPFNDNYFDLIVMGNAIHHLENTSYAISELCRVSKKTAMIVIIEEINDGEGHSNLFRRFHEIIALIDNSKGKYHGCIFSLQRLLHVLSKHVVVKKQIVFCSTFEQQACKKMATQLNQYARQSPLVKYSWFCKEVSIIYKELSSCQNTTVTFALLCCKKLPHI